MKKKWSKWLLGTIVIALMAMLAVGIISPAPVEAAFRSDVISKGQENGWFLDPGDTLTVYYYPKSSSSKVAWQQPFLTYWINGRPFVTGSIYWSPYYSINPTWMYLYNGGVDCFWSSFSLPYGGGVYKFVIKNYTKSAQVTMKVY